MNIERIMEGSILINGIFGGNATILLEINGWIIVGGEVGSADYIDYGELDNETVHIEITLASLYKTHGELLLIFNEITKRRKYEAGIDNSEVTLPENTWLSLQNFNDIIEDV